MSAAARHALWQRLGAPAEQIGSVNEPRTRSEVGLVWNEKWVYRRARTREVERVVLWNRYDLVGVLRAGPGGALERDRALEEAVR